MDSATRGMRAALAPIKRRLSMVAARAVVRLIKDDESRQRLQVEILKGELRDGVERMQDYGFTSHPLAGCDAVIVCAGGTREQSIAVVVDDRRYRLLLQPGEVAIYDDLGNAVKLLRDKVHVVGVDEVHTEAPTVRVSATTVIIDAEETTINSGLTVNGDTTFSGSVTANGKRIDDTHTHGGVQTGGGNTGTPN
ncbi:MAG TPA: phage baseplate assembly protein V [Pseudoxanthomonas sp.]